MELTKMNCEELLERLVSLDSMIVVNQQAYETFLTRVEKLEEK